jgi:glycosyltransferase involved in cell wall biosynthesis
MLACGLPVVTSSTSALPEVVGDAAVLVDPYNVDELRGALGRMNEDLELRAELRRRALARAHSWQFSWQRVARQTLEAYFSSAPARPLAAAVVAAAAAAVASR